jgi:hypothetical protein
MPNYIMLLCLTSLQASPAVSNVPSLVWDIAQRWLVVSHRRLGTVCRYHLQDSSSPFFLDCLIPRTGPIGCPETPIQTSNKRSAISEKSEDHTVFCEWRYTIKTSHELGVCKDLDIDGRGLHSVRNLSDNNLAMIHRCAFLLEWASLKKKVWESILYKVQVTSCIG